MKLTHTDRAYLACMTACLVEICLINAVREGVMSHDYLRTASGIKIEVYSDSIRIEESENGSEGWPESVSIPSSDLPELIEFLSRLLPETRW